MGQGKSQPATAEFILLSDRNSEEELSNDQTIDTSQTSEYRSGRLSATIEQRVGGFHVSGEVVPPCCASSQPQDSIKNVSKSRRKKPRSKRKPVNDVGMAAHNNNGFRDSECVLVYNQQPPSIDPDPVSESCMTDSGFLETAGCSDAKKAASVAASDCEMSHGQRSNSSSLSDSIHHDLDSELLDRTAERTIGNTVLSKSTSHELATSRDTKMPDSSEEMCRSGSSNDRDDSEVCACLDKLAKIDYLESPATIRRRIFSNSHSKSYASSPSSEISFLDRSRSSSLLSSYSMGSVDLEGLPDFECVSSKQVSSTFSSCNCFFNSTFILGQLRPAVLYRHRRRAPRLDC